MLHANCEIYKYVDTEDTKVQQDYPISVVPTYLFNISNLFLEIDFLFQNVLFSMS